MMVVMSILHHRWIAPKRDLWIFDGASELVGGGIKRRQPDVKQILSI
jgi:hypothetical protein